MSVNDANPMTLAGGWSADGATLPGAVDLEGTCYGLSASGMVRYVKYAILLAPD